MIEIKKSELEELLLTICTYSAPKEGEKQRVVGGLLCENLTLGTKRALQKIHKEAMVFYKQLIEDIKEIQETCKDDKQKLETEFKILSDETVKLTAEPVNFSFLENVSSSNFYNFDIIEKIAA